MPLFSIIIPCYNQAHFLSDCLGSILLQEYQDWEAIVVNDGSPDNTNEVVKDYIQRDSRIKLVEKVNGGLSSARNYGITVAQGNRFIFLDADDFMYPDALHKISEQISKSSDLDLIQFGYTYVKEDGKTILGTTKIMHLSTIIPSIFEANLGPCHTFCTSRYLALSIGNFDVSLKSAEDWDYWIRAAKAGAKLVLIQEPLVYYRYARNSMSRNAFVMFEALKMVIARIPFKDERIVVPSTYNNTIANFDTSIVLKTVLIRSVGISIMQGKINESVVFFKENCSSDWKHFSPADYAIMCSSSTFRYWYDRKDIEEVLQKLPIHYKRFFEALGYDEKFVQKALFHIFKRHLFLRNQHKYGKWIGALFNKLFHLNRLKF
jgi:glycosyltransferase involved in cell wall biosynthesis